MPRDDVSLGDLGALVLLLEVGSLTRAAESLGISQPSLSKVLRRLRAYFGDPLLVRVGLSMRPTPKAEQLGFRKIIDTTFMMATMISGDPEPDDVKKYFRALKRAQRDIDLRPELYTHYYRNEFPARWHDQMDTGRWGPGERIVFEPYDRQMFEDSFEWVTERNIFPEGNMGTGRYEDSVILLPA